MSDQQPPAEQRRSVLSALAFFGDRRALVMLALGFSAGLPYLLVFDTLSAWLRVANLSIEVIGYFSLATIASSLKFLWAPLIDRASIPGLTQALGHRRSWMLVSQAAIILGLWLIDLSARGLGRRVVKAAVAVLVELVIPALLQAQGSDLELFPAYLDFPHKNLLLSESVHYGAAWVALVSTSLTEVASALLS